MQDSKLVFTSGELKLMIDGAFFKQKYNITKKMISAFETLNAQIEEIKISGKNYFPEQANKISGKISKGENYLGLPWIVLDNPRVFNIKDIFAYRTLFWWGNYFSFTLHLAGKYLEEYKEPILMNFENLKEKNILVCVNSKQWIHHLEKDNYLSLDNFDETRLEKLINENQFLKLSCKLELSEWKKLEKFGKKTFKEYLSLLTS